MKTITKKFIIKNWDELTDEEKKIQTNKHEEFIFEWWTDICYEDYKIELSELKNKLKYIDFENVYIDENSQGWWIDSFKNFSCKINNKTKNIYDIEFSIRRDIGDIKYIEIDGEWVTPNELQNKKGYKILYKKLIEDFETFQNGINNIVYDYFTNIYNITDEVIEDYFDGMEFEFEYMGDEE